ncbi:MAG: hypothetical protein ABSG05_03285 [Candidatus Pacearchaeota archaeon]|jgi:transcription factor E
MLENLLKEVISLVAGKPAEEIVDLLDTQKYVNEFVIAKKLGLTINQTRNILYKISDFGLVSSIRKKDKRKGWYTYFWKIEIVKALEFLKENLLKKIDNTEHFIKSRETKRFYVCDRCHIELSEENALLNNFTCTECGSLLVLKDNTKMLKDLKKNKEKLERDLALVEEEISKEKGKEDKKRSKEARKEEKIKAKAKLKLKKSRIKEKKLKHTQKKSKNKKVKHNKKASKKKRR